MKIVVIVVTYNGLQWIEKCFTSLLRSSIPVDILAIDNASSDNTVAFIQNKFPTVQIIETGANLGFGRANNLGLEMALKNNFDYVFLLNQDTWVDQTAIEKLIKVLKDHPTFGILAPFQMDYFGIDIEKYFSDYVVKSYTPEYIQDLNAGSIKDVYASSFVHAAGWLLPSATIIELGGFDPIFEHTGEDNDYVQRLHHKQMQIGFTPLATMYHKGTNEGLINPGENYRLQLNTALIKLKNPAATVFGALLLFFKHAVFSIAKNIRLRRLTAIKNELRILGKILINIKSILNSRSKQAKKNAFINTDFLKIII